MVPESAIRRGTTHPATHRILRVPTRVRPRRPRPGSQQRILIHSREYLPFTVASVSHTDPHRGFTRFADTNKSIPPSRVLGRRFLCRHQGVMLGSRTILTARLSAPHYVKIFVAYFSADGFVRAPASRSVPADHAACSMGSEHWRGESPSEHP